MLAKQENLGSNPATFKFFSLGFKVVGWNQTRNILALSSDSLTDVEINKSWPCHLYKSKRKVWDKKNPFVAWLLHPLRSNKETPQKIKGDGDSADSNVLMLSVEKYGVAISS